jgi:hypothetical protein
MKEHRALDETTRREWSARFLSLLGLAKDIFGKDTFRITDHDGKKKLSQPLYDAVMVSLDRLYEHRQALLTNKVRIVEQLNRKLRQKAFYALVVGRPNTAGAVKTRLRKVELLFRRVAGI